VEYRKTYLLALNSSLMHLEPTLQSGIGNVNRPAMFNAVAAEASGGLYR
jgi:hypothetical protein